METILWVAEKRSLADAIIKVLPGAVEESRTFVKVGSNYFVWLDGHAFQQAMPDYYLPDDVPTTASGRKVWRKSDLPIVPQEWVLFPDERKKPRLDKLAELLQSVDVVYNVGDAGEEGQLLVDEALIFFGNKKPVKRILINDYNESKVRQAIANVRDNNEPLFRGWYKWGLARSHYDWLFGLNCTRAMTLRGRELGFDGLLPVGSVQTPLLYIVRERDRAIEEFKPIPYFTLSARLKHEAGEFKATWKAGSDQAGLDESGRLIDGSIAAALASRLTGKPASIAGYEKAKKEEAAPLTFSLNELQLECFTRFGYTAKEVLDAAQTLYDVYKVSTYPRSDNRFLSEAQHQEAPAVLDAVFKVYPDLAKFAGLVNASRKSAAFNDKKMEGQEHHGIVPTVPECDVNFAAWSEVERNVYDAIARSYLVQFAPAFEYMQTKVDVRIDGEQFAASGKTPVVEGWKAIIQDAGQDDEAESEADAGEGKQKLPPMSKGDAASCIECSTASRKTTPPPRFDDNMLLSAMMDVYKFVPEGPERKRLKEGMGIGTTATRAGIIEDIKARELIIPVKPGAKKLMTSPAARTLIDALPMQVKAPAQAGVFKATLDRIAKNEISYEDFIADTVAWIADVVRGAESMTMKLPVAAGVVLCPKCGGQLRRKEGEKGAYWYCSNWNREPDKCDAKYQDANGKPLTAACACPKCKTGQLRRKQGANGVYWYCSNWNADPKCDAKFDDKLGKPDTAPKPVHKCPTCKTGELRSIKGPTGKFWGCNRYEEGCKATFPDKLGKPDLAPKPVHKCPKCKTGELRTIKGPTGAFWGCNRYKEGCKATYPDKQGKPDFAPKPQPAKPQPRRPGATV